MTEVLMWHSKKPRRSQLRGFSIPFWVGGLIPRLATSYSSPSNQRATKLLEKQSDTLTSVMKQKIRELEESKNSFFRYEGLKLYLFWGGMVCNILVFLMLLYGMLGK